jgi:hypothetical protein
VSWSSLPSAWVSYDNGDGITWGIKFSGVWCSHLLSSSWYFDGIYVFIFSDQTIIDVATNTMSCSKSLNLQLYCCVNLQSVMFCPSYSASNLDLTKPPVIYGVLMTHVKHNAQSKLSFPLMFVSINIYYTHLTSA